VNSDERTGESEGSREPVEATEGAGASTAPLGERMGSAEQDGPGTQGVPETPGQRVRSVLAWVGLGLLAGAAGVAVWGLAGGLRTASREDPADAWLLVPLLAVAVLAWAAHMAVRAPREDDLAVRRWSLAAIAVVSVGLACLAFAAFPRDSFPATAAAPELHAPSQRATVLWLALCSTSLGGLLLAAGPGWPSHRQWGRLLLGFPAGVLAVVVAGALVPTVVLPPVLHTVAGAGDSPPEPATVTRVGWTWDPPPSTRIQDVFRGARGALVGLDDGMVALDGATGGELWSYRLPYADDVVSGAVDGTAYVTYTDEPGDGRSEPEDPVTVLLDEGTGEVTGRFALSEEERDSYETWNADLRLRWDGGALSGWSVDGGEELWTHTPGTVPGRTCFGDRTLLSGDRAVHVHACLASEEPLDAVAFRELLDSGDIEGTYAVVGLDAADGAEAWRHEWEAEPSERVPGLRVPPEGDGGPVVQVDRGGSGVDPLPEFLDLDTGEEVAVLPDQARDTERQTASEDEVLSAGTRGALVLADDWTDRGVARAAVLGPVTTEVTDHFVGSGGKEIVVPLADAVLFPRIAWTDLSSGTVPDLMVVPLGDSVTEAGAESVPVGVRDGHGREYDYTSLGLVTVPGAVIVHAGGADRVEGLVP